MNITRNDIDQTSLVVKIEVAAADYSEQVEKQLRKMRSKVNRPGFRTGMVPLNIVRQMYGKSVKAEEVNKLLSDALMNFIKENI